MHKETYMETIKNGKIVDRAGGFTMVSTNNGTFAVGLSSRTGAQ